MSINAMNRSRDSGGFQCLVFCRDSVIADVILPEHMVENPYESPRQSGASVNRSRGNIGCAIILFTISLPMLVGGTLWTLGGSRPHHAHIVVPMGVVTLIIAVAFIGFGIRFCLQPQTDESESS